MVAINCSDLTKRFGLKAALDGLTLEMHENKIIGLIGRNGAGKTTLLKTCAGYLKPDAGKIQVLNGTVFDNLDILSKVVYISDQMEYYPSSYIKDILDLGRTYYTTWNESLTDKLLECFGIKKEQKYNSLSKGGKTCFNIMMGLASRVPITLMDEPTLGLDAAVRKEFYDILIRDYTENPRTIIFSSHLLNEIENMLEEIVIIDEGKLVLHKSLEEMNEYGIYLRGKDENVLSFIKNRRVLSKKSFGKSFIAGIINDLNEKDFKYMEENNIEFDRMSVEEVFIYLTQKNSGGEADVTGKL